MPQSTIESAAAKLAAWQAAHAELATLEKDLSAAMVEYARTRGEPPRRLIIEAEQKREQVRWLFDVAVEAIDAHSTIKTGHTNFGRLN